MDVRRRKLGMINLGFAIVSLAAGCALMLDPTRRHLALLCFVFAAMELFAYKLMVGTPKR